jgi:hypothetical protein
MANRLRPRDARPEHRTLGLAPSDRKAPGPTGPSARNRHSGLMLSKLIRQISAINRILTDLRRPSASVRWRLPPMLPVPSVSHSVVATMLSALMPSFFLSESLSSRRVTEKFLMPGHDRPSPRRLHPAHPPVQFVEHFPTVCAQFLLDSCRKLAALLLEAGDLLVKQGIPFFPGIVPGLQIVAQFSGQFRHIDRRAVRLLDAGQVAPSVVRCLMLFLGGTPPQTRSAIVPVDENPARFGHAVEDIGPRQTAPAREASGLFVPKSTSDMGCQG